MAPAVGPRPVAARARVRSHVSPSDIRGRQNGTGTGFSPSTSVSPVGKISPMLRAHLRLTITGRSMGNFKQTNKQRPSCLWEIIGLKSISTLFSGFNK